MAREGSRKFLGRFKSTEERSAYFTALIRKRWAKQKTTPDPSGGGVAVTSFSAASTGCEDGGTR